MKEFVIERLQEQDCDAVARIAQQSLPEHWSLEQIRAIPSCPDYLYCVAKNTEGEVLGFAGVLLLTEEAELLNIAVSRMCRGQGIATDLLGYLLERLYALDIQNLFLEVRKSNTGAIRLYSASGFEETGIRKEYYRNPKEDAVLMRKCLEADR